MLILRMMSYGWNKRDAAGIPPRLLARGRGPKDAVYLELTRRRATIDFFLERVNPEHSEWVVERYMESRYFESDKKELLLLKAITFATEYGLHNEIPKLWQRGVRIAPNEHFLGPWHIAASKGDVELLEMFFKLGVPMDVCSKELKQPIHYAAATAQADVIDMLVKWDARVRDARCIGGRLPIHIACSQGNMKAVAKLLDLGAQIDAVTDEGWQPIHAACKHGNISLVYELVDWRGADMCAKTKSGLTPAEIAEKFGHFRLAASMRKRLKHYEPVQIRQG
eukprot:Phypoly_transcript_03270.p2 GENE.Phypoly_transcript_03270~~Phypoly_transcript_03270.p2  ORF type:complete len:280 (+),score=44.07 Phypoly_transcript_03270:1467-2306(+)